MSITLQNGALRLSLAPSVGGAIAGFGRDGTALLRETPERALQDGLVRQTSSYPLIPYSNRIAHGRFSFEGVKYQLGLNFGDHPHSIHGNAWQMPWRVAEAEETRCRLVLVHRPQGEAAKGWPFAYRAEQIFSLDTDALTLTLVLENADRRAMLAGLGLHPYFPRRPGVRLQFAAENALENGENSLPVGRIAVPARWDYAEPRDLGEPRLDNCFGGWDGTARIVFGEEKIALRLKADPVFSHLVVDVPRDRDFFAVEPVSHVNNAVNRPDIPGHGLKVLRPGERLTGTVRFGVEDLA